MKLSLLVSMTTKLIVLACFLAVTQARQIDVERLDESFRIIGGKNAEPGEFPYQVSLQWGLPLEGFADRFCAGSIISDRWILTAAHCIKIYDDYPDKFMSFIYAGKHDLDTYELDAQWESVHSTFVHEKYNDEMITSPFDIGLIKLYQPLKFNKRIAPVSLPKKDTEPTGAVVMSGWGDINNDTKSPEAANILQKANLTIIDRKTCNQAILKLAEEMNTEVEGDAVGNEEICTGPLIGGLSACLGDSGGGLINRGENGTAEIVGVASWNVPPCGRKGAPTVFVKVSSFVSWIENIMSNN